MSDLVIEHTIECLVDIWSSRSRGDNYYVYRENGLVFAGPMVANPLLDTIICENEGNFQAVSLAKALDSGRFRTRRFNFLVLSGQESLRSELSNEGWVKLRESSIMLSADPAVFTPIDESKYSLNQYFIVEHENIDINDFCNVFFDGYQITKDSQKHWRQRIETDFSNSAWTFLALKESGNQYVCIISLFKGAGISTMTNLATRREHWRNGLGAKLSAQALIRLSRNKQNSIIMCNPNSRLMYERFGFSVHGKVTYFTKKLWLH